MHHTVQTTGVELTAKNVISSKTTQAAYVRHGDGLSTTRTVGKGVRQGCSLAPLLYLIYDEAVIREATDNMETRISVGGRIINTIRYADKAVVDNSQNGLQ